MKLYAQILILLFRRFILRQNIGLVIKKFAEAMGVVYIKLAQILATQNYGNVFTDKDRLMLSAICDNCNPISFAEIKTILESEYETSLDDIFSYIDETPVGSASISQVHRAVLKTGQEVAVKIKRKDITNTMEHDINQIQKLMHRFGKIISFSNYTGGDHALAMYLEWIRQETDFRHEISNINTYQNFADTVNGKIRNTKSIKVPKLYEQYCTDNVIVMEFIKSPTINQIPLTTANKQKIVSAFNDYIQLSFWAMFNDQQIVFHGDPHSGNVCIDGAGNICFLDMGLLCALNEHDAKLCRTFFLTAYSGNYQKLYDMLAEYGKLSPKEQNSFKNDCQKYCQEVKEKELTYYFIDMIGVCAKYEILPPDFLFNMAKAFVCLNGISSFTGNKITAKSLLQEQIVTFLLRRSIDDCKTIIMDGIQIIPNLLTSAVHEDLISATVQTISRGNLKNDFYHSLDNLKETFDLLRQAYGKTSRV